MALAETSSRNLRLGPNHGDGDAHGAPFPSWKLYHNPHYSFSFRSGRSCDAASCSSSSRASRSRRKKRAPMIVAVDGDGDGGGGGMEQEELVAMSVSSELELCVARIRDLRAELEFERRMRRKAESLSEALAVELAEERRRSGAAEAECGRMREEVDAMLGEVEHALDDIDEERRMLRVAELWREERVQMKLADAKAAVEERLREIAGAGAEPSAAATAIADARKSCGSGSGSGSPIGKSSPTGQHGQQSPTSGIGQLHRREAAGGGGGENPHIRRGIKGFVEFPRAVRVRPRGEETVDLVSNLECQRAQLRVLMSHRNPAAGMGLAGASGNLVL